MASAKKHARNAVEVPYVSTIGLGLGLGFRDLERGLAERTGQALVLRHVSC